MRFTCPTKKGPAENGQGLHGFLQNTLKQQWRKYCKARKRCRKKFTEEAVHQWRIETRRMLSFLSVLAPLLREKCLPKAEALFTRQLKRSARLRDTHVQLLEVESQMDHFPELAPFRTTLASREKRLTRRLRQKITGKPHGEVKQTIRSVHKRLSRLLDPTQEDAHWRNMLAAVDEAFARVRHLRSKVRASHPASIHAVRIAFKKFRYMVEALQPMLPGFSQGQLRQMQEYQKIMGEIQDIEVLLAALDKFTRKKHLPIPLFRDCLRQRHAACIARFIQTAGKLGAFWPFRQYGHSSSTNLLQPRNR